MQYQVALAVRVFHRTLWKWIQNPCHLIFSKLDSASVDFFKRGNIIYYPTSESIVINGSFFKIWMKQLLKKWNFRCKYWKTNSSEKCPKINVQCKLWPVTTVYNILCRYNWKWTRVRPDMAPCTTVGTVYSCTYTHCENPCAISGE